MAFSHPIKLIANALGVPPRYMLEMGKARGVAVAALVGAKEHAVKQVEAGVDILVVAGTEAGGHCGEVSTLVLVPEVCDAVKNSNVAVLAAGGIVTGRQMAACMAMGAHGAWTGSMWLTTTEAETSPVVKEKYVQASSRQTVRSKFRTGKYSRQLRSPWTDAWESEDAPDALPMPLMSLVSEPALAQGRQTRRRRASRRPATRHLFRRPRRRADEQHPGHAYGGARVHGRLSRRGRTAVRHCGGLIADFYPKTAHCDCWRCVAAAACCFFGSAQAQPPAQDPALVELGRALFFDQNLSATARSRARVVTIQTARSPTAVKTRWRARSRSVLTAARWEIATRQPRRMRRRPAAASRRGRRVGRRPVSRWARARSGGSGRPADPQSPRDADARSRVGGRADRENPLYVAAIRTIFGPDARRFGRRCYAAVRAALAAFEQTPLFVAFDSRYDRYLKGEERLTDEEELGRMLFFSPLTNCSSCHQLNTGPARQEPFTNYGYFNIGVPANSAVRALNRFPSTFRIADWGTTPLSATTR